MKSDLDSSVPSVGAKEGQSRGCGDEVPLAEQPTLADAITVLQREIEIEVDLEYADRIDTAWTLASMRFALATLQQHERAMTVVEAARTACVILAKHGDPAEVYLGDLQRALAALDASNQGDDKSNA